MSDAFKVKEHLMKIPAGEPFTASAFQGLATNANIRKILTRLEQSGEIVRVAYGTYVKPKRIPNVGETLPSLKKIAQSIAASTGETLLVHGAEAARQLQLSTQVPMSLVFYTNGNTRVINIGNRTIKLKHVNPSQLVCANSISGIVISALKYLGRDIVSLETIKHIREHLSKKEFNEVQANLKHMPAWMADIFYLSNKEKK